MKRYLFLLLAALLLSSLMAACHKPAETMNPESAPIHSPTPSPEAPPLPENESPQPDLQSIQLKSVFKPIKSERYFAETKFGLEPQSDYGKIYPYIGGINLSDASILEETKYYRGVHKPMNYRKSIT